MSLLITLLLAFAAKADELVEIRKVTPVYLKPGLNSRVLFNLHPHEKVETFKTKVPEYLQIKVIRKGRAYQGFVFHGDVLDRALPPSERSRGDYGFGAGGMYTSLAQKGKSFMTDDGIQHSTSAYRSAMLNPFTLAQMRYEDFWRLTLSLKKTHFTGTATANVGGSSAQNVELKHTFYSILVQRAWMPFDSKSFYFGAGAEIAKANSVDLKLGSSDLSTSNMELPMYLGVLGFVGYSLPVNRWISVFLEARYEYISNQNPAVTGVEGALGVLYWP